jgi:hypothetical protein
MLRAELDSVREQLRELSDSQKITNGKGFPEPVLPLIYENQADIKLLVKELREIAEAMAAKQDHSVVTAGELRDKTDGLVQAISEIKRVVGDKNETT